MSKKNLFKEVINYINSKKIDETYKASKMLTYTVGSPSGYQQDQARQYQRLLVRAGFIKRTGHGFYTKVKTIPSWIRYGHIIIMVNGVRSGANGRRETQYNGLSVKEITKHLTNNTAPVKPVKPIKGVKPTKPVKPADLTALTFAPKKMYSDNQAAYEKIVNDFKDNYPEYTFPTQNALAAFIEKYRYPSMKQIKPFTPNYMIRNYQPIIDNLISNGHLKYNGKSKNKHSFTVTAMTHALRTPIKIEAPTVSYIKLFAPEVNEKKPIVNMNITNETEQITKQPVTVAKANISSTFAEDIKKDLQYSSADVQEILTLSENYGLILSAIDAISRCVINDQFMRARIYNLNVLAQDIAKALSEKQEFLMKK